MIQLSHPVVRDYLAAVRAGSPCDRDTVRIFLLDRLYESGLGAVGEPNGPTLADACWWYAKGSDEDEPALREVLATLDEIVLERDPGALHLLWVMWPQCSITRGERPGVVRELGVREYNNGARAFWNIEPVQIGDIGLLHLTPSLALRDLRRRALALYPEVQFRLDFSLDEREIALARGEDYVGLRVRHHFASHGFRVDLPIERIENPTFRRVEYRQTLTAPQLIPPEYGEINAQWSTINSTPLEDFRRVMDRIRQENALPLVKTPTFILPKID